LFRKGIECERDGNPYEATQCYKRALKLDPDVEKKIAHEDAIARPMDTCNNELFLLIIHRMRVNHFFSFIIMK
jgi:hypothetical protein